MSDALYLKRLRSLVEREDAKWARAHARMVRVHGVAPRRYADGQLVTIGMARERLELLIKALEQPELKLSRFCVHKMHLELPCGPCVMERVRELNEAAAQENPSSENRG